MKTEDTKDIKDYKPISMVRYVYKVITKVLANKLKGVMKDLVSEAQLTLCKADK